MGKGGATWSEMRFPWIAKAASGRPESVRRGFEPPRHEQAYPSPADWRDEIIYFLLVDRFSDGLEGSRPQFDRQKLSTYRQPLPGAEQWDWSKWADSGSDRWQGGTLKGVTSKLAYLKELGVTTIWLSPIFKQRGHLDTYHGYGVQDFLEVDPRFGSRSDLIELVDMAHKQDMRVILDIIFNHSGCNWLYPGGAFKAPYLPGGFGDIVMVPSVLDARERGVLVAQPPFVRLHETAVEWADGRQTRLDAVVWCTGFRPALDHLHPCGLVEADGKVQVAML